jgi:AcrR family transcriptional regulator
MPGKTAKKNSRKRYVSPARTQASADGRARIIAAATRLLRSKSGINSFSLDAVAKVAGVTRLTVYNQFGSRRGVLEAVFAAIAEKGGISRLSTIAATEPPLAALDRLIEIFCEFWGSDAAIAPIFDAMATDPEIAAALTPRIGGGLKAIAMLAARLPQSGSQQDTADLIAVLTSFPSYRTLAQGRDPKQILNLLRAACRSLCPATS